MGFTYKKTLDGRKFLMERSDIVLARTRFLRKMHELKAEADPRQRVYLDETWVNQNHSKNYCWESNDGKGGLKVPTGKGRRLILCHAGSASGFIPECKWLFRSKGKDNNADYHNEMNGDSFRE